MHREMTKFERTINTIKQKLVLFRRKHIPFIVYWDDEVNVCVTWLENKLPEGVTKEAAIKVLNSGPIYQIENLASEIGVDFDKGISFEGRDWEWDFSLRGPISLKFRGPCETKERRQ